MPDVEVDPDVILLVALPPLLYQAAFFSSLHEMRDNARPILSLAIGLVVATSAGVAVVAHEVAGLPWAPAFVLGAVLSPTDPIAASAIASRLGAPRRFVTIVEGESLVNDATGLTLYKLAVAAAVGSGVDAPRGRRDLRRQRRGRHRVRARGGLAPRPGARAAWRTRRPRSSSRS